MGKTQLPHTHESLDDQEIIRRQFAHRIEQVTTALNLLEAAVLGRNRVSKATGKMVVSNEGYQPRMRIDGDSSKWNHASRLGAFYSQKAVVAPHSEIKHDPHAGKDTVLEAGNTPLMEGAMLGRDSGNFDAYNYHLDKMHWQMLQEESKQPAQGANSDNPNTQVARAEANVSAAFADLGQTIASEDQFTLAA
ncbi:MAG: hypothetical protein M3Q79_03765 [bacterium]|nr:hypothetical protein [bacterium]